MMNLDERILEYLALHPRGNRRLDDILTGLNMTTSSDFVILSNTLDRMEMNNEVFRTKDGQYETREMAGVVEGVLRIAKSGVGYIDREGYDAIKVEERDQGTALNGDTVLVRCQKWQVYGTVLDVVRRAREHVIGTYEDKGHGLHFVPDDEKIAEKIIRVLNNPDIRPVEGMKVMCRIEKYGRPLIMRPEKMLGHKDDPGMDILSILLEHEIVPEFPEAVMEQLNEIPDEVLPLDKEGRRDLTGEAIVTIDGDESKDFDDAVGVTKEENGWLLKVSIADVSHYVEEGTPLDVEALKRGTSTYVTDRVVPMLPHALSNGICSLNPHVERLTLTCEMHVNTEGKVTDYEIYPSVIRSTERMTYKNVNRILDGDEELIETYAHLGSLFTDLRDCADAIRSYRQGKGAIDFDSDESEIKVDETGHPIYVGPRVTGHAERIIEDCMIAANVSVANFLKWQEIPAVYRVHGTPKAERLKQYVQMSELLGHKFNLRNTDIRPTEIQRYLESVKDAESYPVLSAMMLRCMQKARYENVCEGHFGLAEEEYLHFTSPIRRYPDLAVHRMLRKYCFNGCTDVAERMQDDAKCAQIAEQSSIRERASQDAEYECEDRKKAEYMEDKIGTVSDGLITSITSFGFFVKLPNTIEGLVTMQNLRDDYYTFNQDRMELTGQRTKRTYRVGMKVRVKVVSASAETGQIDFEIASKGAREEDRGESRRETRTFSGRGDGDRGRRGGSRGFGGRGSAGKSHGSSHGRRSDSGKSHGFSKSGEHSGRHGDQHRSESRGGGRSGYSRGGNGHSSSFSKERNHGNHGRKK